MCGRYTLTATEEQIIAEFGLLEWEPVQPNTNICPTQLAPVVRIQEAGGRGLQHMRWGLIPSWSKDPAAGFKMINARSEEAAGKPAFREAFRRRRCLIPCSGFYEWKAVDSAPKDARKQAYVFRRPDNGPFALAGLWEEWTGADAKCIRSFAILTTGANQMVAPIHDRMPVVIDRAGYDAWLDPSNGDVQRIQSQLRAGSRAELICLPVEVG